MRIEEDKQQNIVSLIGKNIDSLQNQVITLFGTESKDFGALSKVGGSVYLSIRDSDDLEQKYLYNTEVLHSGRLESFNPLAGGIHSRIDV